MSGPLTTDRRGQATDAMSRRRRGRVRALTPTAALSLSLNKVAQAHFHLKHLMRETNKPAPVLLAIQSYLGGCVGAAQAAYTTCRRRSLTLAPFAAIGAAPWVAPTAGSWTT